MDHTSGEDVRRALTSLADRVRGGAFSYPRMDKIPSLHFKELFVEINHVHVATVCIVRVSASRKGDEVLRGVDFLEDQLPSLDFLCHGRIETELQYQSTTFWLFAVQAWTGFDEAITGSRVEISVHALTSYHEKGIRGIFLWRLFFEEVAP